MASDDKCLLCGKPAQIGLPGSTVLRCRCPHCGEFDISTVALERILHHDGGDQIPEQWQVSAYVRERCLRKQPRPIIFPRQQALDDKLPPGCIGIDLIKSMLPKSLSEQLDRTLLNLSRISRFHGDKVKLSQDDYPITFGKNGDEFDFIVSQLATDNLIKILTGSLPGEVQLMPKGYSRVAELERGAWGFSKQVFVAMSFEEELVDAYKLGLEPAIKECGYKPMRADLTEHNEDINDFIIAELRKSVFLVADFTLHRNGVYFEAGFMLGLGRQVIFTCRKDQMDDAHFDTSHRNHVLWEDAEELHKKLRARIQATIVSAS